MRLGFASANMSMKAFNFAFNSLQAKEKKAGDSLDYLHGSNHLSPGSVLEVSFSNDSCLSSSVDDCSGMGSEFYY